MIWSLTCNKEKLSSVQIACTVECWPMLYGYFVWSCVVFHISRLLWPVWQLLIFIVYYRKNYPQSIYYGANVNWIRCMSTSTYLVSNISKAHPSYFYMFVIFLTCRVDDRILLTWQFSSFSLFFDTQFTKRALMQFAENAGLDQPAHLGRLIWAFIVRLQNQWILYVDEQTAQLCMLIWNIPVCISHKSPFPMLCIFYYFIIISGWQLGEALCTVRCPMVTKWAMVSNCG